MDVGSSWIFLDAEQESSSMEISSWPCGQDDWIESSPAKKDSGVLESEKLDISQQYGLAEQENDCILGYIKSMASRSEGGDSPLYFTLMRPHLEVSRSLQFWGPQCNNGMYLVKWVQRRVWRWSECWSTSLLEQAKRVGSRKGSSESLLQPSGIQIREGFFVWLVLVLCVCVGLFLFFFNFFTFSYFL